MQVVWQYHVEEPVSAAGVLPAYGAVRGSRPLYLVQRDSQPRPSPRNQEVEQPLRTWDILNQQVGISESFIHVYARLPGDQLHARHAAFYPYATQPRDRGSETLPPGPHGADDHSMMRETVGPAWAENYGVTRAHRVAEYPII